MQTHFINSFLAQLSIRKAQREIFEPIIVQEIQPKKIYLLPVLQFFYLQKKLAFQGLANFDKDIMDNLNLKSRYLLFASYENINNIDQRLDMTLTAKVNKLINVTVNGTALYDDDF